jgi:hypothetical protein
LHENNGIRLPPFPQVRSGISDDSVLSKFSRISEISKKIAVSILVKTLMFVPAEFSGWFGRWRGSETDAFHRSNQACSGTAAIAPRS